MVTIEQTISSRGQGVHGLWIVKYEISKLTRQDFVTVVTLCSRVHFGKLIFAYPTKKFFSFYENRVFITAFTKYRQRSSPKPFTSHTTYFFDHINSVHNPSTSRSLRYSVASYFRLIFCMHLLSCHHM